MAHVCSVAAIVLDVGALTTMIPRAVAAFKSILSIPTPARPTILSFLAFSITFAVTCVIERVINPSYSPMRSANWSSSKLVSTSTVYPFCLSSSTPFSDTSSLTKIFMTSSICLTSLVCLAETVHKISQPFASFLCYRIIGRSPTAAYRAMSLKAYELFFSRSGNKFFFKFRCIQIKRNIH